MNKDGFIINENTFLIIVLVVLYLLFTFYQKIEKKIIETFKRFFKK